MLANRHTAYPAQQAYVAQPASPYGGTKAEGDAAAAPGAGYVVAGQNVSQNNANMAGAGVAGAVLGGTAAYLAGNGSVGQIVSEPLPFSLSFHYKYRVSHTYSLRAPIGA